jgi:thiol:disulfide interchange protein DsbD
VFAPVSSTAELDSKLAEARASGKPLLLDFYADWCVVQGDGKRYLPCPSVASKLQGYVLLRADVTANLPAHQALLKRFGLYGPPGIILFDANGKSATASSALPRRTPLPPACKPGSDKQDGGIAILHTGHG